jgi:hypothetical protein
MASCHEGKPSPAGQPCCTEKRGPPKEAPAQHSSDDGQAPSSSPGGSESVTAGGPSGEVEVGEAEGAGAGAGLADGFTLTVPAKPLGLSLEDVFGGYPSGGVRVSKVNRKNSKLARVAPGLLLRTVDGDDVTALPRDDVIAKFKAMDHSGGVKDVALGFARCPVCPRDSASTGARYARLRKARVQVRVRRRLKARGGRPCPPPLLLVRLL